MISIVFLDTGPLGLITNPTRSDLAIAARDWLTQHYQNGTRIIVPEIADYELRRELTCANKTKGLAHLDDLVLTAELLPINTAAMKLAAEFWAQARREGRPTAPDLALDGDVILAGQVAALNFPPDQIVVATTNPGHIAHFVPARPWQEITIGEN